MRMSEAERLQGKAEGTKCANASNRGLRGSPVVMKKVRPLGVRLPESEALPFFNIALPKTLDIPIDADRHVATTPAVATEPTSPTGQNLAVKFCGNDNPKDAPGAGLQKDVLSSCTGMVEEVPSALHIASEICGGVDEEMSSAEILESSEKQMEGRPEDRTEYPQSLRCAPCVPETAEAETMSEIQHSLDPSVSFHVQENVNASRLDGEESAFNAAKDDMEMKDVEEQGTDEEEDHYEEDEVLGFDTDEEVREALQDCLVERLHEEANFATSETNIDASNPGLVVPGLGTIGIPISERDVAAVRNIKSTGINGPAQLTATIPIHLKFTNLE
ncbi:hypothetical protein EJ08DRAFT_464920 [Tothia fuscella]|uniref:Uncharacterized protein n=1 Tax=Tothia fuscella TaxID=1048955 RepID=A0A9P4NXT2_9PEZI|nr:hypothetical protein EJ08DRAFT_464920 [Tothia fuscella]